MLRGQRQKEFIRKSIAVSIPPRRCSGDNSFDNVEKVLFEYRIQDWEEYKDCPNLLPGCTAYVLRDVSGHLGIVELSKLDPEMELDVIDNKRTGKAKCLVSGALGPKTNMATIILGTENGVEVVYTYHPGLPVKPDEIPVEKLGGRTNLSVSEAIDLGFTHACIA